MKVSCPHCKNQAPLLFTSKDYNQEITQDTFYYYRCSSCKLIFIFPIPTNLSSYYISTYPAYQIPKLKDLDSVAEKERYKIEILQQHITKGRLLEIGPSYGGFAYLAQKSGFEVEAIEMNSSCCKFLTEVVKITAINTQNVSTALQGLRPYNVIVLWHVIEHLVSPWEILEVISDKLLPNGILVLAAPNPSALQFRIFKQFWVHVDAPRHLQLIPVQLLINQMESLGLTTVSVTTTDKASAIFSNFNWWKISFDNFFKEHLSSDKNEFRVSSEKLKRKKNNKTTWFSSKLLSFFSKRPQFFLKLKDYFVVIIFRLIFWVLLKPIENLEGQASAYTVIFRKKENLNSARH